MRSGRPPKRAAAPVPHQSSRILRGRSRTNQINKTIEKRTTRLQDGTLKKKNMLLSSSESEESSSELNNNEKSPKCKSISKIKIIQQFDECRSTVSHNHQEFQEFKSSVEWKRN